jgi:response regulator RpfG family c-di-GMP phosphodiesterase
MSLQILQEKQFVIIDDDQNTLYYSSAVIKKFFLYNDVLSFKDPSKAVEYFYDTFSSDPHETLVLLDIHMPGLSGWNVLDKLALLSKHVKEKLSIIIVSSSIDINDKIKANENSLVIGYIEKPLSIKKLKDLLELRESTIEK